MREWEKHTLKNEKEQEEETLEMTKELLSKWWHHI
jgi:hypothetical protein